MASRPIWAFASALRADLFAAMSGGFSVPFGGLAVFAGDKYQQLIWAALAFCALGFTSYRLWRTQHDRVTKLEAELEKANGAKPKNIRNVCLGEAVSYVSFREWGHTFMEAMALRNGPCVQKCEYSQPSPIRTHLQSQVDQSWSENTF
jgi:hypothetical protein